MKTQNGECGACQKTFWLVKGTVATHKNKSGRYNRRENPTQVCKGSRKKPWEESPEGAEAELAHHEKVLSAGLDPWNHDRRISEIAVRRLKERIASHPEYLKTRALNKSIENMFRARQVKEMTADTLIQQVLEGKYKS